MQIIMVQRLTNRNILFNNRGDNEIRINFFIRVHNGSKNIVFTHIHIDKLPTYNIHIVLVRETLLPARL